MRYFLEFSYNGKQYHGWQRQPNGLTVQEELERVLSTLLRTPVEITGAGRTDAGVHARFMAAHFDFEGIVSPDDLIGRMNSFLPQDIAIKKLYEVTDEAHARFDAISRTYEYWVVTEKNPFLSEYAYHLRYNPDLEAMNKAAAILFEYDDFQCFSKSNTDVKTYRCKVYEAHWKNVDNRLVFTIKADRFLRNMVRAIVGTLLEVGSGKISLQDVKNIIESKNRSEAGVSVPAHGLYLTNVEYPSTIYKKQ